MRQLTRPILLVEDNADDEELTKRALQEANLTNFVVVARDGAEALALFAPEGRFGADGPGTLPAVVLLDLQLPKISGIEVLRRYRQNKRLRFLPVVVLTSSDEVRDLLDSYRLGANSYVRKPVGFAEFLQAVKRLGLYWAIINESPPHSLHSQSRSEL